MFRGPWASRMSNPPWHEANGTSASTAIRWARETVDERKLAKLKKQAAQLAPAAEQVRR